jgi:homoserine O-acetyltransferase
VGGAGGFVLERGATLAAAELQYAIFGKANPAGDNVVLVCHALSGSARVDQWWPVLLHGLFNLERDCVICFNILGSCYGSTGPSSIDPATGKPYGASFPLVTVRDIVRAQKDALDQMGYRHFRAIIGVSLGGMQALQWAVDYPESLDGCIAIGATPLSAMGLALNHIQRGMLKLGGAEKPQEALALARQLAMCSYKSAALFARRHGRRPNRTGPSPFASDAGRFDVAGYLDHQGEIFLDRFDPDTYRVITQIMDLFDPARDHGSPEAAWSRVRAKLLLLGITSDWLFPSDEVRALAGEIRSFGVETEYHELTSEHGHDSFLAEEEKLLPVLRHFLGKLPSRRESAVAVAV